MQRHTGLIFALVAATLGGCTTLQAPTVVETDPVDGIIARNAASATQALRDWSESSGNSRVVTSTKPAAGRPPAGDVSPTAAGAVVEAAPQPIGYNIASHRTSVAVDGDTPRAAAPAAAAPNTGVVASGGLLSVPPAGLERLVTVRWTGDLEELLSHVAQECGWHLGDATGLRVAPVIISINAENRSAFEILRDAGAIAGEAATISVSAQTKTISVRYPQR